MIAISTPKITHTHTQSPAIEESAAGKNHFTIGTLVTRAEIERNEWLDK